MALICFALPFLEVSCQGRKALGLTGIQLALGSEYQQTDAFGRPETKKIQGDKVFLAALGITALALVLCSVPGRRGAVYGFICGIASLGLLVGGKIKTEGDLFKQAGETAVCNWQIGFWAAGIFLLVAILVSARQMVEDRNRPPGYKPPEFI